MTTASVDTDKTANYDMQTDQVITCVSVGYALPATTMSVILGPGRVSNVSCSKNVAFGQGNIAYYQLLIQTGIGIQKKSFIALGWDNSQQLQQNTGLLSISSETLILSNNKMHHWTLLL